MAPWICAALALLAPLQALGAATFLVTAVVNVAVIIIVLVLALERAIIIAVLVLVIFAFCTGARSRARCRCRCSATERIQRRLNSFAQQGVGGRAVSSRRGAPRVHVEREPQGQQKAVRW